MYNIHIKPEISTLRVYKTGQSYKDRSTAVLSCTVHYISDSEVYLCNASGNMSRVMLRTICLYFHDEGYKIVRYERNKEVKEVDLIKLFNKGD